MSLGVRRNCKPLSPELDKLVRSSDLGLSLEGLDKVEGPTATECFESIDKMFPGLERTDPCGYYPHITVAAFDIVANLLRLTNSQIDGIRSLFKPK